MQKHCSGHILDNANSTFRNTILVMSVDTTEGDGLVSSFARRLEFFVGEDSVVAMIVPDANVVRRSKALESQLALDDRRSVIALVKMDVFKITEVIYEYSGIVIAC